MSTYYESAAESSDASAKSLAPERVIVVPSVMTWVTVCLVIVGIIVIVLAIFFTRPSSSGSNPPITPPGTPTTADASTTDGASTTRVASTPQQLLPPTIIDPRAGELQVFSDPLYSGSLFFQPPPLYPQAFPRIVPSLMTANWMDVGFLMQADQVEKKPCHCPPPPPQPCNCPQQGSVRSTFSCECTTGKPLPPPPPPCQCDTRWDVDVIRKLPLYARPVLSQRNSFEYMAIDVKSGIQMVVLVQSGTKELYGGEIVRVQGERGLWKVVLSNQNLCRSGNCYL